MDTGRHELGMIGLGVMGRNMLLNMADHGFPVVGYDKDASQGRSAAEGSSGKRHTRRRQYPGFHRTASPAARGHDAGARRSARGFRDRRSVAAPRKGRSHHRRRQLLLQRHEPACPQPDANAAFNFSASAYPAARRERATARASCPADRKRRTSGCACCLRPSPPRVNGDAVRSLPRPRIGRAFRQDGPQRHRVRA